MIVNSQKPIVFDNVAKARFDPVQLEQAILMKADKPVARIKRVFMHGRYPAVSIHGRKLHIHRLLMEYWSGSVAGMYVDHINGDKQDISITNLRLLEPSIHQSITNKGRKQTPEHVAKRINATIRTRYGHSIYKTPEPLETKDA